jgi:hypothetical protein
LSKEPLKTICQDFAALFNHTIEALQDHETQASKTRKPKPQKLENPSLKNLLLQILDAIGKIEQNEKSEAALEDFRKLCETLGWADLEEP